MEIYKLQQLWVLVLCMAAGALCGVVYDSFRAWRRCFGQTAAWIAVCDIVFWIISAVIVYAAVYISNSADLRWHELIGLAAGFALYTVYVSRHCIKLLCMVIKAAHKIFFGILRILRIPCRFLHTLILPLQKLLMAAKTRIVYIIHCSVAKIIAKMHTTAANICKK